MKTLTDIGVLEADYYIESDFVMVKLLSETFFIAYIYSCTQ